MVELFKQFANIPYNPNTHKIILLLDWDRTCGLSSGDCRPEQFHAYRGQYKISGNMAISDEPFYHDMMIRPGLRKFLQRVMHFAYVCIITAGDLQYIRQTITNGNNHKWLADGEVADGDTPHIPLTNVFSVRNHIKRAAPKTFARVVPFLSQLVAGGYKLPVVGLDDDVDAWAWYDKVGVVPISPLNPLNKSPEFLERAATEIEQRAIMFYTMIAAEAALVALQQPAAVETDP
jgi:hypothetical protein